MVFCRICGRLLKSEKSIKDGVGPGCKKKLLDFDVERCLGLQKSLDDYDDTKSLADYYK